MGVVDTHVGEEGSEFDLTNERLRTIGNKLLAKLRLKFKLKRSVHVHANLKIYRKTTHVRTPIIL